MVERRYTLLQLIRRLRPFLRPYVMKYLVAIALLTFTSLLSLLPPFVMKVLIDNGIQAGRLSVLNSMAMILVGLAVLSGISRWLMEYVHEWVSARFIANLRGHLFQHILSQSMSFFASARTGDILGERISSRSTLHPEWFFSNKLFGAEGLKLISNSWEDLQSDERWQPMANLIVEAVGGSTEDCLNILGNVSDYIESCVNGVDWAQYRMVGFSVTFAQTLSSLLLAHRLKEKYPHLAVVFGGANVDSEMGLEILKGFDWIDYVVHGEAERTLPDLLKIIMEERPFQRIPGVSARQGDQVIPGLDAQPLEDLNESPRPDYSDYFSAAERAQLEKSIRLSLPIESSRGCWWGAKHHCTFCGLNGTTMGFRKKSADRVYDEIVSLSRNHRCLSISAVDNILDMGYFRELLPRLEAENVDLSLFYEVKANLSREQVRQLASAGVSSVQPGIESLNTDLLRLMRKGITAIQNIQFLKWCSEFDVDPLWNILYGFPGENPGHYDDYPKLFRLLFHLKPPGGIVPVVFERFSPYHFESEKFNLKITPLSEYHMLYPEMAVDYNKLAYYFDGVWEGMGSPELYIQPAVDAYDEWVRLWQAKGVVLYYEKGPGFLIIYDNRPKPSSGELKMRRLTLNELQSKIYLFCDENRSFNAIMKMLSTEFRWTPTEREIAKLLDQFVEEGLMFRERDRYLSLAVRKNSNKRLLRQACKFEEAPNIDLSSPPQETSINGQSIPALVQLQKGSGQVTPARVPFVRPGLAANS